MISEIEHLQPLGNNRNQSYKFVTLKYLPSPIPITQSTTREDLYSNEEFMDTVAENATGKAERAERFSVTMLPADSSRNRVQVNYWEKTSLAKRIIGTAKRIL